ncbi:MAG: hypothetical protein HQK52_24055 [Oligoflexia bacterium]|nr:hypothetical protein [Oligoflexia bacterium]
MMKIFNFFLFFLFYSSLLVGLNATLLAKDEKILNYKEMNPQEIHSQTMFPIADTVHFASPAVDSFRYHLKPSVFAEQDNGNCTHDKERSFYHLKKNAKRETIGYGFLGTVTMPLALLGLVPAVAALESRSYVRNIEYLESAHILLNPEHYTLEQIRHAEKRMDRFYDKLIKTYPATTFTMSKMEVSQVLDDFYSTANFVTKDPSSYFPLRERLFPDQKALDYLLLREKADIGMAQRRGITNHQPSEVILIPEDSLDKGMDF